MKSVIGNNLVISLFGESHSQQIGATITGLAPGIRLDLEYIKKQCEKRKAKGNLTTQRQEADEFEIICGLFEGVTTGTPLTILIGNKNIKSKDYQKEFLRPSHADYTAYCKYLGFQDYRGGGHFSGRLTAPLVVVGAICKQILKSKGIEVASHIRKMQEIEDSAFALNEQDILAQFENLDHKDFPCLDDEIKVKMQEKIADHKSRSDSVGGILESVVVGLEPGIGEPFFDSIESRISHLLFSVPAVKGVSFGLGFGFNDLPGSKANDSFYYDGQIKTKTNHNGGINGGISNGMPIIVNTVIKPTPSIYQMQKTVNYLTKENIEYAINGRHDPCILARANVVIESMIAFAILDLIVERYGYMWMVV